MKDNIYDHYIAIDWSIKNMAIARMTKKSNKITAIDVPSDIEDLQAYLKNLRGTKILAIEETTTSKRLKTLAQTELRCFRPTPCASEILQRQQPITITSHPWPRPDLRGL